MTGIVSALKFSPPRVSEAVKAKIFTAVQPPLDDLGDRLPMKFYVTTQRLVQNRPFHQEGQFLASFNVTRVRYPDVEAWLQMDQWGNYHLLYLGYGKENPDDPVQLARQPLTEGTQVSTYVGQEHVAYRVSQYAEAVAELGNDAILPEDLTKPDDSIMDQQFDFGS